MTVIIIKYYFKIVSLEIAATWKFPWVKWQGLGRLFTIADMVHNCIEWGITRNITMLVFYAVVHAFYTLISADRRIYLTVATSSLW